MTGLGDFVEIWVIYIAFIKTKGLGHLYKGINYYGIMEFLALYNNIKKLI